MTGRARGAVPHRALLLVAWAAVAAGRACPLWQIIEPEVSRFNRVEGSLNGYALELRGDLQPTIRGKILQSYENGCPLSMSALESSGFSLETSESEPILVDYAEVKVGPAKIALTGLRAAMERHHFDASVSLCGPNENFGGPCFSGTISLRALTGNAHVLGHDIDLTGQVGNVDIRGYMDPDEQELRLQITWMHVNYDVHTPEAHGNLELTGFLRAAAQLPFTFSFDNLRAETNAVSRVLPANHVVAGRSTVGRLATAVAVSVCAAALLALGRRAMRSSAQRQQTSGMDINGTVDGESASGLTRSAHEQTSELL